MSNNSIDYEIACYTLRNTKPDAEKPNEDSFWVAKFNTQDNKSGAIICVCDGVGGQEKGDYASSEVIRVIKDWFSNVEPCLITEESLTDLLVKANDVLVSFNEKKEEDLKASLGEMPVKKAGRKRTTTTCSLVVMLDGEFISINAGDTRIYHNLIQISEDHTVLNTRDVKLIPVQSVDGEWVLGKKAVPKSIGKATPIKASTIRDIRHKNFWTSRNKKLPDIKGNILCYDADSILPLDQPVVVMVDDILSLTVYRNYLSALSKQASIITSALGQSRTFRTKTNTGTYTSGDIILIGSDGFWHHLDKLNTQTSSWYDDLLRTKDMDARLAYMGEIFRDNKEKDDITVALVRCKDVSNGGD